MIVDKDHEFVFSLTVTSLQLGTAALAVKQRLGLKDKEHYHNAELLVELLSQDNLRDFIVVTDKEKDQ